MKKKFVMFSTVLAAGALMNAFAQVSNVPITLDVIVRDFQPSHPDFENFSEESVSNLNNIYSYGLPGYDLTWYNLSAYHNTCGNKASKAGVALGMDGLPLVANPLLPAYLQQVSATGGNLMYGQCNKGVTGYTNAVQRGFKQSYGTTFTGVIKNTCSGEEQKNSGGNAWGNEVYYTPGMVQQYLTFDYNENNEPEYLEGAHIHKLNEACDNVNFGQWFEDVSGINKTSKTVLDIPTATDNAKYKELDYNYNNGGYFPLDAVDGQAWAGNAPGTEQWGPQSFSIFCPPYAYQYANTQTDFNGNNTAALCTAWNQYGGARGLSSEAAMNIAAANGTLGLQHLRNYNFTMMGYANFKYYKQNNTDALNQEIFEFAGDDDMWIFVDGVLVVDLGGTHLATPGIVNIRTLAENNHGCQTGEPLAAVQQAKGACGADGKWADGSWHHLHFFYADRQTDGSNLYIRANLAEVAASAYGQPRIIEAEVDINESGSLDTYIYTSSELADVTIASIAASNGTSFPILSKRPNSLGTTDTLAFKVEAFQYVQKTSKGYSYKISGKLCTDQSCAELRNPAKGDSLSFNFPFSEDHRESSMNRFFSANNFAIYSKALKAVDTYSWGPVTKVAKNTSTSIIPADTTIDRPPFDVSTLDGGELADDQTGEIIIVPLPADYANAEDQSAWIAQNMDAYSKAPGGDAAVAGQVVLNSRTKGSSGATGTVDNARCATVGGVENCVSFSFVTDQAFRVTVRVFDHLGHFVNQYSQELSTAQFNAITNSNVTSDEECLAKPADQTGNIVASVKTYPVAKDGRKLGTGAYIYQVSLVEYPQKHCVNIGGDQTAMDGEYKRTEYKETRGFRRIVQK